MQWVLLCLITCVLAWTAPELEIFRLNDAVIKDLDDKKATFYSWLGVKPNADAGVINKAYRKLSQRLHPDKNPIAGAHERFSRLGLVNKILQNEHRDTYDFYLRHGFPSLNEAGEYVFPRRFRPSLAIAVGIILFFVTAGHYLILKVSAIRQKQHVQGIIDEAFDKAAINGVVSSKRTVSLSIGRRAVVDVDGTVTVEGAPITTALVKEPGLFDTVLFKWAKGKKGKGKKA